MHRDREARWSARRAGIARNINGSGTMPQRFMHYDRSRLARRRNATPPVINATARMMSGTVVQLAPVRASSSPLVFVGAVVVSSTHDGSDRTTSIVADEGVPIS